MFGANPFESHLRSSSPATNPGTENHGAALPPPTETGQQPFGWHSNHSMSTVPEWGLTTTNSWSRHPSRRPSVNSNLPTLGHESVLELDGPEINTGRPLPSQLPIGTDRPHSSAGTSIDKLGSPPRLNPAAKDFTMLLPKNILGGGSSDDKATAKDKAAAKAKAEEQREQKKAEAKEKRDRKKAEKAEKNAEKAAAKAKNKDKGTKDDKDKDASASETVNKNIETPHTESREFFPFASIANSPATSRRSRDTYSVTTTDPSFHESRDSLDRPLSRTPSENLGLTPLSTVRTRESDGKETFMQKLTRKSSSGMFNFPSLSNKPGSLFSSRNNTPKLNTSEFADETEEDEGIGGSVGDLSDLKKDKEKITRTPGLGWAGLGLRKMSKKTMTESESGDEYGTLSTS